MTCPGLLRISVGIALLYGNPAYGIGIVRGPDLREEAEHPKVEAVPSGSAALEEDIGKGVCYPFAKFIEAFDIAHPALKLSLLRKIS